MFGNFGYNIRQGRLLLYGNLDKVGLLEVSDQISSKFLQPVSGPAANLSWLSS